MKSLADGRHLYRFSADILTLVRHNARVAVESADTRLIFHVNLGSIFLAGSYLEASLNEDIAICAHAPSPDIKPNPQFWVTLGQMQRDLSAVQKWNLIAAARGGQQWNGAAEPYQSYDTLVALRNELVHFKGRFVGDNLPPIKRLKPLLDRFKSTRDWKLTAMKVDPWLVSVLSSGDLALWIESSTFNIHTRKEELLLGYIPSSDAVREARKMVEFSRYGPRPKTALRRKRSHS